MRDESDDPVSPYPAFQLARALAAGARGDAGLRERAQRRVRQWSAVLAGQRDGTLAIGSRKPVKDVPAWATLEVVTGGFATGALMAGGALQAHEREQLQKIAPGIEGSDAQARAALNRYYLSDDGLAQLGDWLDSGRYDITVPEEGALLVLAWLLRNRRVDDAHALMEALAPWFARLRFYPAPRAQARDDGDTRVHVESVGRTMQALQAILPRRQIQAQQEALRVWVPLYDEAVGLLLETVAGDAPVAARQPDGSWQRDAQGRFAVSGGWPCAHYPEGWRARAESLLARHDAARLAHTLCGRPSREKHGIAPLVDGLRRCATDPASLSGREVGRLRLILARYVAKRGLPGSAACETARQRQRRAADGPDFPQIAAMLLRRLAPHASDDGLDDVAEVLRDAQASEGLPAGTAVPASIRRKLLRCGKASLETLVAQRTVTSGEMLARLLPQRTAALHATGIDAPALQTLYAALYRAFRRRRSLLLLDLQHQVQFEELPWVAVLDAQREGGSPVARHAQQLLADVAALAIDAFPHTILPNKLLQELRALADAGGLQLPLTEEVAVDIFMGRFSPKYLAAAQLAATMLEGTLYARYYGIDTAAVRALPLPKTARRAPSGPDALASLCAQRAGVPAHSGMPAANGMVVEQQQVLTTHNLAALYWSLDLQARLGERLPALAQRCFTWLCRRLQKRSPKATWHARLIQVKRAAYAWRQMVFFLALCTPAEVHAFMAWARAHLQRQPADFRQRFQPALDGLAAAVASSEGPRVPFLGWSTETHWLLRESPAATSAPAASSGT